MVAMQPWTEEHPELVHAFRQAIIRAAEFANTHPQETRNVLSRYVLLEKNILDTLVLPRFIEGSLNAGLFHSK